MSLIPLALAVGFTLGLFTAYVAQYRTPCGNNSVGHRIAHISGTHSISVCLMEFDDVIDSNAERYAEEIRSILAKEDGNMTKGLSEMPKVGEKVRFIGGTAEGLTNGQTYLIGGEKDCGSVTFKDDFGRLRYIVNGIYDLFELVPVGATEPQPDVHALLANLGRRLHEVEEAQERSKERKFYDDMVDAYKEIPDGESDAVNSPAHYKRGKYETIDVIEEITQGYADGFVAHCAGTAIKYIARAPFKHATPTEDLRKAAKYLEFAIKRLEAGDSE